MGAATTHAASSWLARIQTGDDRVLIVLVGVGLALAIALGLSILLAARRRSTHEVREIVTALEELRAGPSRRKPDLAPNSPLAVVGDAIARLGQDLHVRASDAAETSERLDGVLDAFRQGAMITTDLDGDVRTLSDGALALLGWERDDALGLPVSTFFGEGAYETILPRLTRRAARERGLEARTTLRRKDGATFPAELTIRTLHRASGDAGGFLIVVHDVTRQVGLETELRESQERYRSLVEGLSVGTAIVRGGRVLYANPAFASLCGVERERLVERPLREHVATGHVLLLESRLAALEAAASGRETVVCALVGGEGRVTSEVRLDLAAIPYADGTAILLLAHDESAARRAEAEVRTNESRLDAVLESTSDGILLFDDAPRGGVARMTNAAFLDLAGLFARDVLGRSPTEIADKLRGRGAGYDALAQVVLARDAVEARVVRLEGAEPRELTVAAVDLDDQHGRPCGRVVACRDLTAHRESERRLKQHADELECGKVELEQAYRQLDGANRELQARTAELDRLNVELRKLDEMRTNLLGNVSHELQTPLVSIRGYTEMILKERLGPLTNEQRRGLELCLSNVDRLITMIDGLAAVSRPEPAEERLTLSRFALADVVEEAHALLLGAIGGQEIQYSVDLGPEPLVIHGDRDRILQVFLNLLGNAVKFNVRGGRIDVRAARHGMSQVDVEVRDTGIGIPPEALDRIFDRHFRASGDPSGAAGRGLGLTIVRDVLRLHGGRIDVTSEPGRGTTFRFTLPLAIEE
jgi:PAS domain S-box-containing protein